MILNECALSRTKGEPQGSVPGRHSDFESQPVSNAHTLKKVETTKSYNLEYDQEGNPRLRVSFHYRTNYI